jgi:septum formation inhibitor MinC
VFRLKHDAQAIKSHLLKASKSMKSCELVYRHDFLVDTTSGLKLVKWDNPDVSVEKFVEQAENLSSSLSPAYKQQLNQFMKEIHRQVNSVKKQVKQVQQGKTSTPSRKDVFSFVTHESHTNSAPELPDLATAPDLVVKMYLAVAQDWMLKEAEADGAEPPSATAIYNFNGKYGISVPKSIWLFLSS